MTDDYLKALQRMQKKLLEALAEIDAKILAVKRRQSENVPAQTGTPDDSTLPLHSEVEHPDKSESSAHSRPRRRRGS